MNLALKTAWNQPRVTWGGASLEELSQVKAEIKKIPDKFDVEQPLPLPPPLHNPKHQALVQAPNPNVTHLSLKTLKKHLTNGPVFCIWRVQGKTIRSH